jgi:chitin synthase
MLYFLAIPSMSMLLMIYSLGNLHVVSWGTRETKTATPQQGTQQNKPRPNAVQSWLDKMGLSDVGGNGSSDYQFSFGNLFRYNIYTLGKIEGTLKYQQSRDLGNIGNKTQNET